MKTSVQDAMTAQVVAVKLGASFKEMAARLRQSRVSAFPVIDDDGKVIGVVSEADMLASKVLRTGMPRPGEQDRAEGLTARDLMTHPAITISPEDSVEVAARLMYTLQVKRLPVIDRSGRLAGIISRTDVLAVSDRSDEEIRKKVTDDAIRHEPRPGHNQLTEHGRHRAAAAPGRAPESCLFTGRLLGPGQDAGYAGRIAAKASALAGMFFRF